jgi:ketosteroid isomerase-like protein
MSQENVELAREGIDAMNRRDIEGVLRLFDPDVRFEHRLAALQGKFVGIEGVKGWFIDLVETFESWRIDCPDLRDLGDKVLGLGTLHATGRESGIETEQPFTVVCEVRDGRITDFTDYGDRSAALEAVGLRE